MNVAIVTIGDEILIGQVLDTNSAYISQRLNSLGLVVKEMLSISDNFEVIEQSILTLFNKVDLIITTGGLGPTSDDITKLVLCKLFDTHLVLNKLVLDDITTMLSNRGIAINENNYSQAMQPEKAIILSNKKGTAPGLLFVKDDKYLIALPGVPFEMRYLINNGVESYIKKHFKLNNIIHKTLIVVDIAESILAEKIKFWEAKLPNFVKLAYLPSPGLVKLRLSIYDATETDLNTINTLIQDLKIILSEHIIADEDLKIEEILAKLLLSNNLKISVAESCTGGYISSMISSIAGASQYFMGDIVAYDNSIKTNVLNVCNLDIINYGAVSQEVVEAMLIGAQKTFQTDCVIATTGIAGPSGGSREKPVGTVWIGIYIKGKIISQLFHFKNDREINIIRASNTALTMMIKELKKLIANN